MGFHGLIVLVLLGLLAVAGLSGIEPPTRMERIQDRGTLTVATRIGESLYFETESGPSGLEYELLARLAERLGVRLEMIVLETVPELTEALNSGEVDFIAGGIGPTPEREQRFAFSAPYMTVQPQVVYRTGGEPPEQVEDLVGKRVEVLNESLHEQRLAALTDDYPKLDWHALEDVRADTLLYRLWQERSDYAVTDSNILALNQAFYPELRVGFDLGPARPLAWMLRPEDEDLRESLNHYIHAQRRNGFLAALEERYYGHLRGFDYVGTRVFMRHVTERLPRYREWFETYAAAEGLDWRLLAAIGYQESHWNPDAVSPTGVRGIMMLTRDTARLMEVRNRRDPEQSIRGGAAYFDYTRSRVPERIPEPTRTWLALAAYNVGYGHMEDARVITEMRGGNPDDWTDVRESLPLLTKKKWYSQVQHGYARGHEPVEYVENIRKYYDLLTRMTNPGLIAPEEPTREAAEAPEIIRAWRFTEESSSTL